jgi:biotin-[acetyl-CoA-carboxylase] ligase BirA-like protein
MQARSQYQNLRPGQWFLYTASHQTSGVGQYGRRWISAGSVNIYATYSFLIDQRSVHKLLYMPQIACLQVVKILEQEDVKANIKWINDVLVQQKKICGVLVESFNTAYSQEDRNYIAVLIGIGINVNSNSDMLRCIDQPATSMMLETGQIFEIPCLIQKLSNLLMISINNLLEHGYAPFWAQINAKLEKFDNKLILLKKLDGSSIEGCIKGITNHGQLILVDAKGGEHIFIDGRICASSKLDI